MNKESKPASKRSIQGEIQELIKPSKELEMDYGLVQSYCESRDACRKDNKSADTEEDILF
ncbi:MAG: hypothetical protein R8G66_05790 [Cytophagales bacterium]|nr:hypothetical protein [Cytophagales bacterium]